MRNTLSVAGLALLFCATLGSFPGETLGQGKIQDRLSRCFDLQQQFQEAIKAQKSSPSVMEAEKKGSLGIERCNSGSYFSGIDLLEQAIRALGQEPKSAG